MSNSGKDNSNKLFWSAVIAVGAITSTGLLAFYLLRTPTNQEKHKNHHHKKVTIKDAVDEENVDNLTEKDKQTTNDTSSLPSRVVVAEDVDTDNEEEDEEDGEEEDDNENESAAIKSAYDSAGSSAKRMMAANKFLKAAERYTDAIQLLSEHSFLGSSKDMLALYNNRSAMFEKNGSYPQALEDIMIALSLDPLHVKARLRRSRIYEAQGKFHDSIADYTIAMFIEQTKAETNPTTTMDKVEELCAAAAKLEMPAYLQQFIANSDSHPLPSPGYIRPYLHSFPAHFQRELLTTTDVNTSVTTVVLTEYKEMWNLLQKQEYIQVFEIVKCFSISTTPVSILTADILLLQGTFYHLQYNLVKSRESYELAIQQCKELVHANQGIYTKEILIIEYESKQKLAQLYSETYDLTKLQTQLLSIIIELEDKAKSFENGLTLKSAVDILLAWSKLHKSSFWIAKAEQKPPQPEPSVCLANGLENIESSLKLCDNITNDNNHLFRLAQSCKALSLLKWSHVKIQSSSINRVPFTDEDIEEITRHLNIARKADPNNEQVDIMEAEALNTGGKFDEAVALCENVLERASKNGRVNRDCSALVIMSSAKIQVAMFKLNAAHYAGDQSAAMEAQASLGEIVRVFERALEIEPNSVEALFRYAHFKSMLGDYAGSNEFASRALEFARSKEEMEEVKKLTLLTSAQVDAIKFIQKSMRF